MVTSTLATVTIPALTPLEENDHEFVAISEQILRYGMLDLQQTSDIELITDMRERVNAIGRYVARMIHSRQLKLEAQNNIAEIRLRQERKIGQLLSEMEKHTGGRPAQNQSHDETSLPPTLADIGISKSQSSRWQLQATLPEDEFNGAVMDAKERGWELASVDIQRRAREYNELPAEKPRESLYNRELMRTDAHGRLVLYDLPPDCVIFVSVWRQAA